MEWFAARILQREYYNDSNLKQGSDMDLNLSPIIAHRGASQLAPENTLSAFNKAVELGAQWIECDVQLTKDDQAVIMHDFSLNRTTNGQGKVAELELQALLKLDAGSWFNPQFKSQKIVSLAQALAFAKEHNVGLNLELKCNCTREKMLAQVVHEQLKNYPLPVLISSFNYVALEAFRSYAPHTYLALNCDYWDLRVISQAKKIDCFSVHVNHKDVTPTLIEECNSNFLKVLAYTVNDKKRAEQLLKLGVTSVFSDIPDLL